VDDEDTNLILFEANLETKYDIITAGSGKQGLEVLSNSKEVKVVFSDMKMPHMNGIEFIKQAKKIAPSVRFYILTGFEITNEIQEALNNGLIKKYFRKPFNMNEISIEIDRVL
jgi:response regulator RpfG family c-di-GMP phosphodiesterase